MHINKTDSSLLGGLYNNIPQGSASRTQPAKDAAAQTQAETDSSQIDINLNKYVQKEKSLDQVDFEKILKAKRLLESGELDQESFIEETAGKIIKLGF